MITRAGKIYVVEQVHATKRSRARQRSENTAEKLKEKPTNKTKSVKKSKKSTKNTENRTTNEDLMIDLPPLPHDDEFSENTRTTRGKMSDDLKKVQPLKMDGNLSENWRRFKRNFDIFMRAGELNEKTDAIKINTLLNAIGEEAVEVFDSFNLTEKQQTSYTEVVKSFADFCAPKKNPAYERYMFNQRSQKEGEPFDNFLIDIKRLVRTCEYADKESEMLRDRIVIEIHDTRLQSKLLEIATLTYDAAVEKCRAHEATKEQTSTMSRTATVSVVRTNTQNRNTNPSGASTNNNNNNRNSNGNARGSYTRNRNHNQNTPNETKQNRNNNNNSRSSNNNEKNRILDCKFCGYSYEVRKCPAFGETCKKCNKKNHFKSRCKTRDVSTLDVNNNSDTDYEFDDNAEFFVHSLNEVNTAETDDVTAYPWIENISINKTDVPSKVDTGAEVDVMPLKILKRIFDRLELQKTGITLKVFGGAKLKPIGTCVLNCFFNGMFLKVKFAVVDLDFTPILSLKTCIRFKIVEPSRKHTRTRTFHNSNYNRNL